METAPGVVVIGGGWSGLSCAVALAGQGRRITVLEERGRLGGRASSFPDPVTGEEVDNGQHLLMASFAGCRRFLGALGTAGDIRFQKRLEVPMIEPTGRRTALRCPRLPAPLHLLAGILRHGSLDLPDRLGMIRGWRALRRGRTAGAGARPVRDATVEQWLDRAGQTEGSRRAFWRPLAVAALNEEPARASSRLFEEVLRRGFLADRREGRLGVPGVPLSRLVDPAAREFLEARGGRVILNAGVSRIRMEGGRVVSVRLRDGSEIAASEVVAAVPPAALLRILPEQIPAGEGFFEGARRLESSPILSVHLWYDREVLAVDFAALLDSPVHWVFRVRRGAGSAAEGSHLALVTSAARDLIDRAPAELGRLADTQVRRYLPDARDAALLRSLVVKERQATFSPRAGVEELRPGQRSPVPNLLLAGDWTRTGLPGSLESAVRSGQKCAEWIDPACRAA
jgi:squalene-associated FAD-dependent desaturase